MPRVLLRRSSSNKSEPIDCVATVERRRPTQSVTNRIVFEWFETLGGHCSIADWCTNDRHFDFENESLFSSIIDDPSDWGSLPHRQVNDEMMTLLERWMTSSITSEKRFLAEIIRLDCCQLRFSRTSSGKAREKSRSYLVRTLLWTKGDQAWVSHSLFAARRVLVSEGGERAIRRTSKRKCVFEQETRRDAREGKRSKCARKKDKSTRETKWMDVCQHEKRQRKGLYRQSDRMVVFQRLRQRWHQRHRNQQRIRFIILVSIQWEFLN